MARPITRHYHDGEDEPNEGPMCTPACPHYRADLPEAHSYADVDETINIYPAPEYEDGKGGGE